MAQFTPGQILQRGDLTLFLQDSNGAPTNAAEITYELVFVDPGPPITEVVIPPTPRTPVNPVYGEYYAAVMVPPSAQEGDYRIRWTFKEVSNGPDNVVVQNFEVVSPSIIADPFSSAQKDCIRSLRILLRDNCIAGEELVTLDVEDEEIQISLEDLYNATESSLSDTSTQTSKILDFFHKGKLKVQSVSPQGFIEWKKVTHIHRHEVPWEKIVEVVTVEGKAVLTGGHRVFISPTEKVDAEKLCSGDKVLSLKNDEVYYQKVLSVEEKPSRKFMYDLTAEDYHNFSLSNRMVVSNSPDRNYHFRPPEHEGVINNFNRVFGYVWEDYELLEYLLRALDWWNTFPPETEFLCSLEVLAQRKPAWKTFVLWGAISLALNALAINWVHEEFSVSGDTLVDVRLPSGEIFSLPLIELHEVCKS